MKKVLFTLAALTLIGAGCVSDEKYQAFIYKVGVEISSTTEGIQEAAGPVFKSLEECIAWSRTELRKYPDGDASCGMGCRVEMQYGNEIICKENLWATY